MPSPQRPTKTTARFPGRPLTLPKLSGDDLAPPEGDRAADRTWTGAHLAAAVIAGLNDPVPIFLADDLADVVRPHDNGADAGRAGVSPSRPIARKIEFRPWVTAYQLPHCPTTPSSRAASGTTMICVRHGHYRRSVPELLRRWVGITSRRVTMRIGIVSHLRVSAMPIKMLPRFCALGNCQCRRDRGH
jgi:hypothetical protein